MFLGGIFIQNIETKRLTLTYFTLKKIICIVRKSFRNKIICYEINEVYEELKIKYFQLSAFHPS